MVPNDAKTLMDNVKRWRTLNATRPFFDVQTTRLARSTMEFAHGILLDQKFLCMCVRAAFVNMKVVRDVVGAHTIRGPIINGIWGSLRASRDCTANLVTARALSSVESCLVLVTYHELIASRSRMWTVRSTTAPVAVEPLQLTRTRPGAFFLCFMVREGSVTVFESCV